MPHPSLASLRAGARTRRWPPAGCRPSQGTHAGRTCLGLGLPRRSPAPALPPACIPSLPAARLPPHLAVTGRLHRQWRQQCGRSAARRPTPPQHRRPGVSPAVSTAALAPAG
eukprot:15444970-Alexandrium_andersonii.AAC.1